MAGNLTYRPELDGLRAIAVSAVLLFHAGGLLPGGFVGVDVFFVISGFLITSLILKESANGTFSFLNFWDRRVRRLAPAAAVLVVATLAAGYFLMLPHEFRELGQSVFAQAIGLANFYFWRESGYFDTGAEGKPLLHCWSLAVEEQFYVLAPLAIVWLAARSQRQVRMILFLLLGGSSAWCIYETGLRPSAAFYLLPARAWELILGSAVAFLVRDGVTAGRSASLLSGIGLVGVLASLWVVNDEHSFPGAIAWLPCGATALFIWSNTGSLSAPGRVLTWAPFVFLGKISYSVYLWHWPMFAFANYYFPGGLSFTFSAAVLLASLALGAMSWKFVEEPFRRRHVAPTPRKMFATMGAVFGSLAAMGLVLNSSDGLRLRLDPEVLKLADGRYDLNPYRRQTMSIHPRRLAENGLPVIGLHKDRPVRIAVIGDSHADSLLTGVLELCEEHGLPVAAAANASTIPALLHEREPTSRKERFRAALFEKLKEMDSLTHVILVARWTEYTAEYFQTDMKATFAWFEAAGIKVAVVRQVPATFGDLPRSLALAKMWNLPTDRWAVGLEKFEEMRKHFDELFAQAAQEGVTVIDLKNYFYGDGKGCRLTVDGRPLYYSQGHLSVHGASQIKPFLRSFVASVAD